MLNQITGQVDLVLYISKVVSNIDTLITAILDESALLNSKRTQLLRICA